MQLYEFEVVALDSSEALAKQRAYQNDEDPPENNSKDWLAKITLDMENVIGYRQTRVKFNDKIMDAVVVESQEGFSLPLLVPYEVFKDLHQKVTGIQVKQVI